MFKKVLIANRGEIAVRVIRACREMGIRSVAVYSDVDRASFHVRKADEAYHIGPATATESYLNIAKILDVAKRSGAEAIHPGYGFLSENANFARACTAAGIKFIGPTGDAMDRMGSKTRARQAMSKADVPFVPGTLRGLEYPETEIKAAEIGYPIMLKAAAGGGGKGMRMVRSPQDLKSPSRERAVRLNGLSGTAKFISRNTSRIRGTWKCRSSPTSTATASISASANAPCSAVIRRYSKNRRPRSSPKKCASVWARLPCASPKPPVTPTPVPSRFIVDQDRNFYFLEMNTRLQVEHPVTELVTGLDLVHLQMHIAAGEPLPFRQEDVKLRGHAIECRIYAEDPDNNFFPSPGKITLLLLPSGPGIRRDSGMYEGWTVPLDYDPLLAKLIGYGSDREQAIARLQRALYEYFVGGIKTNISLFRRILRHPDFRAGNIDTGFLDRLLADKNYDLTPDETSEANKARVAAIAAGLFSVLQPLATNGVSNNGTGKTNGTDASKWKQAGRREALHS